MAITKTITSPTGIPYTASGATDAEALQRAQALMAPDVPQTSTVTPNPSGSLQGTLTTPQASSSPSVPSSNGSQPATGDSTPTGPGLDPTSFMNVLQGVKQSYDQNNSLINAKNLLIKGIFTSPLSGAQVAQLPPDIQQVYKTGNKDAIELQIQALNERIQGGTTNYSQSVNYLVQGYQASLQQAEQQKQDALDTLFKVAQNFVDPKTGTIDTSKMQAALEATYPGVDVSGIVSQLNGMTTISGYNAGLQYGFPNASNDPVTLAMQAIVGNESGGDYNAVSPVLPSGSHAGEKSYGKYQVLQSNIPTWTKEATGVSLTPEQFLASPEAQDAVAKKRIGDLWAKYGNIADVASVWFTGLPASQSKGLKDSATGTTSEDYIKKAEDAFNQMQAAQPTAKISNQMTDNERALFNQFNGEPIVKDYNTILAKKLSVDAILDAKLGGPGDLSVVYEFMKGLDPTSVVRETEYDSAAKSGNIFAGAFARFNGYLKPDGGFLPENVKNDFQSIVDSKLKVQTQLYNNVKSQYEDVARRQGLNPQNVVIDYSAANTSGNKDNTPTDPQVMQFKEQLEPGEILVSREAADGRHYVAIRPEELWATDIKL